MTATHHPTVDTGQSLMRMLGITQPHVTAVDVRIRPEQELPTVTVQYLHNNTGTPTSQQFALAALTEPVETAAPLDLDALCAQALAQVQDGIQAAAALAHLTSGRGFYDIGLRIENAMTTHATSAAKAMDALEIFIFKQLLDGVMQERFPVWFNAHHPKGFPC